MTAVPHTNTLRTDGGNGGNNLTKLKSIQDGGLTGRIEADLEINGGSAMATGRERC